MNRIAIDIDEVLMPFVKPLAKWNKLAMPTKPKYGYVYSDMFNISSAESRVMVRDFYKSEVFGMIQPFEGSVEAMTELRKHSDKMFIVTGRQEYARTETEDWINVHYPGIFDEVILTNSYTNHEVYKSDLCMCLNVGIIVDDNDTICALARRVGVTAIQFAGHDGKNVYPWCSYSKNSVLSWPEAVKKIIST